MLKLKVHRQIKRQKKKGKIYNVEQKIVYIPSKAEVGEEVYVLTEEELKELITLIPQEKRPNWLVKEWVG
ncbi:t26-17p [Thermococci archaeon]|nr:MAG: t26-17p [Thermococci archaeon]